MISAINPKGTNKYLPIGTVVFTKKCPLMVMIIGLKIKNNEAYDYMGVFYPNGFKIEQKPYLFNHEEITNILYLGNFSNKHNELNDFLNDRTKKYDFI